VSALTLIHILFLCISVILFLDRHTVPQEGVNRLEYEGGIVTWDDLWCPDFIVETNYVSG